MTSNEYNEDEYNEDYKNKYIEIFDIFIKDNTSIIEYNKNNVNKIIESVKIVIELLKRNIIDESQRNTLDSLVPGIEEIKSRLDKKNLDNIVIDLNRLQDINYSLLKSQTYKLLQNVITIITEGDNDENKKDIILIIKEIYSTLFQYIMGNILNVNMKHIFKEYGIIILDKDEIHQKAIDTVKELYKDDADYEYLFMENFYYIEERVVEIEYYVNTRDGEGRAGVRDSVRRSGVRDGEGRSSRRDGEGRSGRRSVRHSDNAEKDGTTMQKRTKLKVYPSNYPELTKERADGIMEKRDQIKKMIEKKEKELLDEQSKKGKKDILSLNEKNKMAACMSLFSSNTVYNMYSSILNSLCYNNIYKMLLTSGEVKYVDKEDDSDITILNKQYITSIKNIINSDINETLNVDTLSSLIFDKKEKYIEIIDNCITNIFNIFDRNYSDYKKMIHSIKTSLFNKTDVSYKDFNNLNKLENILYTELNTYYTNELHLAMHETNSYFEKITDYTIIEQSKEISDEIRKKYINNKSSFLIIILLRFIEKYIDIDSNKKIIDYDIFLLIILYNMIVHYAFPQNSLNTSGYCNFYSEIFMKNMYRYKIYNIMKDIKDGKYYNDKNFIENFKNNCMNKKLFDECLNNKTFKDIDIKKQISLNTIINIHDYFKVRHYFWKNVFNNKKENLLFDYYNENYENIYDNNINFGFKVRKNDNRFNYNNILDFISNNFGIFASWVYDNGKNTLANYINKTARSAYNIWIYSTILLLQDYILSMDEKEDNGKSMETEVLKNSADKMYDNRISNYFFAGDYALDSHHFNKYVNTILATKIIDIISSKFSYDGNSKLETRINNILSKIKDNIKYLNIMEFNSESFIQNYIFFDGDFKTTLLNKCDDVLDLFKLYKLMEYNYLYPYYKESVIKKIKFILSKKDDTEKDFIHNISEKEILDGSIILPEYDTHYTMYTDIVNSDEPDQLTDSINSDEPDQNKNKNKKDKTVHFDIIDNEEDADNILVDDTDKNIIKNTLNKVVKEARTDQKYLTSYFDKKYINKRITFPKQEIVKKTKKVKDDYEIIDISIRDLSNIVKENDNDMRALLLNYSENDTILQIKIHKKFIFLIYILLFSYTLSFSKLNSSNTSNLLFDRSYKEFKAYIQYNTINRKYESYLNEESDIINDDSLIKILYDTFNDKINNLIKESIDDYENYYNRPYALERIMDYMENQINESIFIKLDKHINKYIKDKEYNGNITNPYTFLNTVFLRNIQHKNIDVTKIYDKIDMDKYEIYDAINGTYVLQKIVNIIGIYSFDSIISKEKQIYEPIHKTSLCVNNNLLYKYSIPVHPFSFHSLVTYYDNNKNYITFDSNFEMNYIEKHQTINNFGSYCITTHNINSLINTSPFLYHNFNNTMELIKDYVYKNKYDIGVNKFFGGKNKTIHIIAIITFVLMLIIFIIAIIVVFVIAIKKSKHRDFVKHVQLVPIVQ